MFPALLLALPVWVLATAAPVPAAPKADGTLGASAPKLLEHRKVQKELKLSAEQRIGIIDAIEDVEETFEPKFEALGKLENPPEDAYDKLFREQAKAVEKVLTEAVTKLTPAQRARLRQLDLHVRGPVAFADPAVANALKLTDDQKKKAAEVEEQVRDAVDKFLDGFGDDDEATRKAKLFALRAAQLKELVNGLTKEQQEAWSGLYGPKPAFDADALWLRIEEDADLLLPPGG